MNAMGRIIPLGSGETREGGAKILPASDGSWVAAEAAHPGLTSIFGSETWISVLEATYGFDIETAVLERDGIASAAMSFADIDDLRGRRIVSLPFSDFVDPLVTDRVEWDRLIAPVLARGALTRFRVLRNRIAASDARFTREKSVLWHSADLSTEDSLSWSALDPSARQNIRRAKRNGLVVTEGRSLRDVEVFYNLHLRVRKSKYRLLAQPFSFFANIHEAFSRDDRIVTLLAKQDGEAVAGILFLIDRGTLYYKFNASCDARYRPNDLLVWHGMRLGRERGLDRLDFGISDLDQPGLVRFKRKFATVERPVVDLKYSPLEPEPGRRDVAPLLTELTAAFTHPDVPDETTRTAGDTLYRLFS